MPRASMDGSIFPDLEREQMSTAHTGRTSKKSSKGQTIKNKEKGSNNEENRANES